MFSRAHMILGAFDRPIDEDDNEIPQEVEKKHDVEFHTLGNLDQYQGLLPEDTVSPQKDFLAVALENCKKFNEEFEGTFDKS